MMMGQERITAFTVGLNDLAVLRAVLSSYLTLVRRAAPPSRQRDEEIALLQGVYRRISCIPAHTMDVQITLYALEMPALDKALSGYAAFVCQKVPPSRSRDETLRNLERFRQEVLAAMR